MTPQVTFHVEYTDTFGGDTNYSWVKRYTFTAPNDASNALLMRRAKKLLGLSGVKGRSNDYGDIIEWRPYGMCTVLFITVHY